MFPCELPGVRPGDIVVLDNLRSHNQQRVTTAIEKMWSKVKAILRKLAARASEALDEAIRTALEIVTPADAAGWLASCGYRMIQPICSRAGENYAVGNIAGGNTAIVAKKIAERTVADLFEVRTVGEYAETCMECEEEAKRELRQAARPKNVGDVADFAQSDTIYVGYPIWRGVPPMCVSTAIEKHDWTGKTRGCPARQEAAPPKWERRLSEEQLFPRNPAVFSRRKKRLPLDLEGVRRGRFSPEKSFGTPRNPP